MSGGPLDRLRHHVTGAIERGEAVAIVCEPVPLADKIAHAMRKGHNIIIGTDMLDANERDELHESFSDPRANFLAYCEARIDGALIDSTREFWRRLAGSVRKARDM
jgi:hypothetical protein